MSDQNNNNDTQPLGTEPVHPKPMRETSTVPLRKETVRVTLKSTPAGVKKAEAPRPPAPTAMSPVSAPMASAPAAPRNSDIPDVTSAVPLKQETMRVTLKAPAPAAARKAPAAPAPAAPAPAAPSPAAPSPVAAAPVAAAPTPAPALNVGAAAGQPTVALATHSLPKATVQLQQTQQLGQPGMATSEGFSTLQTAEEEVGSDGSTLVTVLAVVAFVFSLIFLFVQVKHAGIWVNAHEDGSYGAIFSASE